MVLRDIDADGVVRQLFRAFACHSGLAAGYPCRPTGRDEGDPTLTRPVKRSASSRSIARRCREGCHPLRFLLAAPARKVIRQASVRQHDGDSTSDCVASQWPGNRMSTSFGVMVDLGSRACLFVAGVTLVASSIFAQAARPDANSSGATLGSRCEYARRASPEP
jgi:hypothetical protein